MANLSKPLQGKTPLVRTTAGLLAINSLLLAAGVWAFVIFRPQPKPEGSREFDLARETLPMPKADKSEEEAAPAKPHAEGHDSATGEPDEHGATKAKGKTKSAKAPPKNDKKPPAKKGAAKPEEHKEEE